jgi:hypothetical protein
MYTNLEKEKSEEVAEFSKKVNRVKKLEPIRHKYTSSF